MIIEIFVSAFLVLGAFLILVASIGVLRLPDIFMRLHAATKAVSLGIVLLLMAVAFEYPHWTVIVKAFVIVVFVYLTLPVSASMLGKSSLDSNLKRWEPEKSDDSAGDKPEAAG